MLITRLKNCNYRKVKDFELGHYYEIYNKKGNYIATVLLYQTVLTYNKHGVIY